MSFSVTFLGGAGFIGMNMYLYESDESALIVDCGVMFADYSYPGIDYIVPDFSYLYSLRNKLKGLLLTHAHEDHVGGVPYLLKNFNIPVWGGFLTLKLLKLKLSEYKIKAVLNEVTPGEMFRIDDFSLTYNSVNHSIPDTYSILLKNKNFSCLHASDFKIDYTPVSGAPFDWSTYEKIGNDGVDLAMVDSTNIFEKGETASESALKSNILDVFLAARGRIFFTTFASNVDRIRQVMEVCFQIGRKVVLEGRSVLKNTLVANENGFLPFPENTVVKISDAKDLPDNEVCYIVSGCQGESGSSLFKIVSKERKKLRIKEGDTVVISSRVIPGNEKNLNAMMNQVALHGGNVVDMEEAKIHTSGHAGREDIKEFLNLLRPDYVIPIHGEIRHQKEFCRMLEDEKLNSKGIFAVTGEKAVFDGSTKKPVIKEINSEYQYIDTRGGFFLDNVQLKERKHMARDGVVIVRISTTEKNHEIETVGFILSDYIYFRLSKFLRENLILLNDVIKDDKDKLLEMSWKLVKTFFKKEMDRRPVIKIFIE